MLVVFILVIIFRPMIGTDDDDVIIRSFEAFEINGQIDAEM